MSGSRGGNSVKVVIINTQYVQTDPASFKSVVQKLTGKDSKVSDSLDSFEDGSETRRGDKGMRQAESMMRNLSFKELDWLVKEMPTMEELDYLWTGQ